MVVGEGASEEFEVNIGLRQGSGVARGGGMPPPKLLMNVFSPINLRCYVLLVCKWSLGGDISVVQ